MLSFFRTKIRQKQVNPLLSILKPFSQSFFEPELQQYEVTLKTTPPAQKSATSEAPLLISKLDADVLAGKIKIQDYEQKKRYISFRHVIRTIFDRARHYQLHSDKGIKILLAKEPISNIPNIKIHQKYLHFLDSNSPVIAELLAQLKSDIIMLDKTVNALENNYVLILENKKLNKKIGQDVTIKKETLAIQKKAFFFEAKLIYLTILKISEHMIACNLSHEDVKPLLDTTNYTFTIIRETYQKTNKVAKMGSEISRDFSERLKITSLALAPKANTPLFFKSKKTDSIINNLTLLPLTNISVTDSKTLENFVITAAELFKQFANKNIDSLFDRAQVLEDFETTQSNLMKKIAEFNQNNSADVLANFIGFGKAQLPVLIQALSALTSLGFFHENNEQKNPMLEKIFEFTANSLIAVMKNLEYAINNSLITTEYEYSVQQSLLNIDNLLENKEILIRVIFKTAHLFTEIKDSQLEITLSQLCDEFDSIRSGYENYSKKLNN